MSDCIGYVPVVWDCMVMHDGDTTLVPCETPSGEPVLLLLPGNEAQRLARLLLVDPGEVPPQRHAN